MRNYLNNIFRVLPPKTLRNLLPLILLIILGTILETFGVWVILPVFNLFKKSSVELSFLGAKFTPSSYGIDSEFRMAIFVLSFFMLFYVFKTIFLSYLAHRQNKFAYSIQTELAHNLFRNYLEKPWTFHLVNNSALLTRNIIVETSVLTSNAILPAMLLLTESFAIVGIGILLITIEPLGSMITMFSLGLIALVFNLFTKRMINKWGHLRQYHEGKRMQHLQQGLGGVKEVILLRKERFFIEAFDFHNNKGANANQNQITLQQMPRLFIEFFAIATLSILVLVLLYFNKSLDQILPVLGIFSLAAFRLMPSISRVMNANQSIRFVLPALSIIKSDINYTKKNNQIENHDLKFSNQIEFKNINFRYENQFEDSIKDLNVKINKGDSIGIIGTSGAGKSTFVDIVMGLLFPTSGTIEVDGINIQNNLKAWYKLIGYVPQSIFLTDDTIKNNIAFGINSDDINCIALENAITAAHLTDFIDSLPDGVETLVGERGTRISGGQRQRIAIARALYHNPEVLIFDEATSALDDKTEESVMNTINSLMGSKTLIIVTHKLQTVSNCNKIFKIENGAIYDTIL